MASGPVQVNAPPELARDWVNVTLSATSAAVACGAALLVQRDPAPVAAISASGPDCACRRGLGQPQPSTWEYYPRLAKMMPHWRPLPNSLIDRPAGGERRGRGRRLPGAPARDAEVPLDRGAGPEEATALRSTERVSGAGASALSSGHAPRRAVLLHCKMNRGWTATDRLYSRARRPRRDIARAAPDQGTTRWRGEQG
jgi:hypothetical protein